MQSAADTDPARSVTDVHHIWDVGGVGCGANGGRAILGAGAGGGREYNRTTVR